MNRFISIAIVAAIASSSAANAFEAISPPPLDSATTKEILSKPVSVTLPYGAWLQIKAGLKRSSGISALDATVFEAALETQRQAQWSPAPPPAVAPKK